MTKNAKPRNSELICLKCDRPVRAKMLCASHYNLQYYKPRQKPRVHPRIPKQKCEVAYCKVETERYDGLCQNHSRRRERWGLTTARFVELMKITKCEACGARKGKRALAFDHDHKHCKRGCADSKEASHTSLLSSLGGLSL